jgi:hypothetical protein
MRDNKELEQIGKGAYASIVEMVEALQKAEAGDDESARETAREAIEQDPLSVRVRGGWHNVGETPDPAPEEYEILLSTGGPATRIVGEFGEHGEPSTARLQAQDWGTPWTDYREADESILVAYVSVFYFGE